MPLQLAETLISALGLGIQKNKFMKKIFFLLNICLGFHTFYVSADELENCNLPDSEILFVSLGSVCETTHILRFCELRQAAFPFDWIVSMDGEALINILQQDFQHFLDDQYFMAYGPACLHTYYHLEFLHDGDFTSNFEHRLIPLKNKYKRRIERFSSLKNFPGKVIFLRCSYPFSLTDGHRFYHLESNLEISEEYATRLHAALKNYFPDLDFHLIILNLIGSPYLEQKLLNPTLSIVTVPGFASLEEKIEEYKKFFMSLISDIFVN